MQIEQPNCNLCSIEPANISKPEVTYFHREHNVIHPTDKDQCYLIGLTDASPFSLQMGRSLVAKAQHIIVS